MDYTYDYVYSTSQPSAGDVAAAAAVVLAVSLFVLFFALVAYVIMAWLLGRIFKKAGLPQWAAWVPVYNNWKLLEIGGQQGFWAVLALIPIVNIVAAIFIYIAMYHVGKKLGKEDWFVLLAIFLPIVWFIWLAFDDSKWQGKKPAVKKP
jgi:hypothetical protein